jgi:hypothetical protein
MASFTHYYLVQITDDETVRGWAETKRTTGEASISNRYPVKFKDLGEFSRYRLYPSAVKLDGELYDGEWSLNFQ